jgi:hypothetical protein
MSSGAMRTLSVVSGSLHSLHADYIHNAKDYSISILDDYLLLLNHPRTFSTPCPYHPLHLTLNLVQQPLQLALIRLLTRPLDPQPLRLIRLRNQMKMHMIHHLMRNPPVVLQDIVVLDVLRHRYLLGNLEDFG